MTATGITDDMIARGQRIAEVVNAQKRADDLCKAFLNDAEAELTDADDDREARAELEIRVAELTEELREVRAGGAWVEHVERQKAMKRERDGDCICNTGPDSDGPDEYCPWHGRPYSELLDALVQKSEDLKDVLERSATQARRDKAEIDGLRMTIAVLRGNLA